jgi:hypothetical protein
MPDNPPVINTISFSTFFAPLAKIFLHPEKVHTTIVKILRHERLLILTTSGRKVVHEFSPYKIKSVNSGKCYTFFEKSYMIHAFSAKALFGRS